jgi:hypothetical protein
MVSESPSELVKSDLPGEPVTGFWANYLIQGNMVRIWVKTNQGGWQIVRELPPEQAVFLSNMLLSGKQLYYIKGVSLYMQES